VDVGARLVGALRIVPSLGLTALFPAAAALAASGQREALDALYVRSARWIAALACVGAAALVASASPLVTAWLGTPMPLAAETIVVLAPAYALNVASGPAAAVTRAEGAPGRESRYGVLATAVNALLTVPSLLVLGPKGVPLSTSIAIAVATAYFLWRFHRETGRPLRPLVRALWTPFAAAGIAVAVTAALDRLLPHGSGRFGAALTAGSDAAFAATVTLVLLGALGFLDGGERAFLRRRLARVRLAARRPALVGEESSW
jgi:O-antigen/teichoic acid export membrane protein